MQNNQKRQWQKQRSQPFIGNLKKAKSSKKTASMQFTKFKLNITKKFKQDFIQSISKIQSFSTSKNNTVLIDEQLQKYKKKSLFIQNKPLKTEGELTSSFENLQKQRRIVKKIKHLSSIRKEAFRKAKAQNEDYEKKMNKQKQKIWFKQYGQMYRNDSHKKKNNIHSMLKKCQRLKEIQKFQNQLIYIKKPQKTLPIRFFTESIHEKEHKSFILKKKTIDKSHQQTPNASNVSIHNKLSRQQQTQLNNTVQNFKSMDINMQKPSDITKLKKIKPNGTKKEGARVFMQQLKRSILKSKLGNNLLNNSELKKYHMTEFISPWVEEYELNPKYQPNLKQIRYK